MRPRPPALLLAAAVQAIEAAGLLVAAVLTALDTAAGRSYQRSSGIALTVIAFGAVVAVAFIAYGIYRVRRWSRTPALYTQLFVGSTGFYLAYDHRVALGVPMLVLAIAGFAGLLVPPSLRALAPALKFHDTAATDQPAAKVAQPAAQAGAASPVKASPVKASPVKASPVKASPVKASSAAQSGATVPPAARTARPSGKKPSSRRR